MKKIFFILLTISLFANEDFDLISLAYKSGLKAVPSNFESLLLELNIDQKELNKEKILLGEKLFFEKNLSLNKDISCASCHMFDKGGTDGIPTAIGHKNRKNPFHLNTPTVLNTGFSKKFFWNGSSKTLESQAKGPLQAPFEMAITPKQAEYRIQSNSTYVKLFKNVYGIEKITFNQIIDAICAYEKTLVTKGRYDKYLLGDEDALTFDEKKGLSLFINKGCVGCHNGIGLGGQVLRKFPLTYHKIWIIDKPSKIKNLEIKYNKLLKIMENIHYKTNREKMEYLKSNMSHKEIDLLAVGFFDKIDKEKRGSIMVNSSCTHCHKNHNHDIKSELLKNIAFPFENKGGFLGSKDLQKYFRVPLLRNVVNTSPYFHNGSIEKLEDAIKLMGIHQSRNNLSDDEIDKIISFLKAVNGEIIKYKIN